MHVWYLAYGSNLSARRLGCYLAGGRPPGAGRHYEGCRRPDPPTALEPMRVSGAIRFAGRSATWGGGGVAFLDIEPGPGPDTAVLGRAYLSGADQLDDLMAKENGAEAGDERFTPSVGLAVAQPGWSWVADAPGGYRVALCCGRRRGLPVVTLTTSRPPADLVLNPPSVGYLATMVAGLAEAHGLDPAGAARYLASWPGAGRSAAAIRAELGVPRDGG